MARKKQDDNSDFVMVNVLYEDGAQRSNRKVSRTLLSGFDDENDILTAIIDQDRKIEEMSGQPRGPIKKITRAA